MVGVGFVNLSNALGFDDFFYGASIYFGVECQFYRVDYILVELLQIYMSAV